MDALSGAVGKAGRLKPEARLAQAISEFEASLSGSQKASFRAYKSQTLSCPPTVSDVTKIVAEMNGRGSRRCFGPRFMNVMAAVQQFASFGDVLIGGSQNIIAAGVWSLVRLTLYVIVNFSTYFEKLSSIFMVAGRSAPYHEALGLLYPESKTLQAHISEYYIVLVRVCHQMLKFAQKSVLGQLVASLNESELKAFQSELESWGRAIRDEMSLLLAKSVVEEGRRSSNFRSLSNRFREAASHQERLKARLKVLAQCSTLNYQSAWKQARKAGRATLLDSNAEYRDWKASTASSTLVCTGKLGSGKSVLLATVVDDLYLNTPSSPHIAYCFCRHDVVETLVARNVIGTLSRQLLEQGGNLSIETLTYPSAEAALDVAQMLALLERALPAKHGLVIVVDGLDSCEDEEKWIIIRLLRKLQDTFRVRLCLSFTLDASELWKALIENLLSTSVVEIPTVNPDIESYIDAELEACIASGRLALGDPRLVLDIREALLKGAQGMFLWVALQIKSLCYERTDEAIRRALDDLPKDLSETFSRVILRGKPSDRKFQRTIFGLMVVARRPLTVEELREAVSVAETGSGSNSDPTWQPAMMINDIYGVLACCGSLITIEEEDLTVHLIHHSAKTFLTRGGLDEHILPQQVEDRMAYIILTYLNYELSGKQVGTLRPRMVVNNTPAAIIQASLGRTGQTKSLALQLLRSRKMNELDIGKVVEDLQSNTNNRPADQHQFRAYARAHGLWHVGQSLQRYKKWYDLARKVLRSGVFDGVMLDEFGSTPLWYACRNRFTELADIISQSESAGVNSVSSDRLTPLVWACDHGWLDLAGVLVVNGADVEQPAPAGRVTPLEAAVRQNDEPLVTYLVRSGARLETKSHFGQRTPLGIAAELGHETIVGVLLAGGASVEAKDDLGRTPLANAAESGRVAAMERLIAKGADLETRDLEGRSPLSVAAMNNSLVSVERLLQHRHDRAYVEQRNRYGQTALSLAAKGDKRLVLEELLRRGADKNSIDDAGRTPLSWAVTTRGSRSVVEALIQAKAMIELEDRSGRTPLSWAAASPQSTEILRLLLAEGALVRAEDSTGWTPYVWALSAEALANIQVLMERNGLTELGGLTDVTPRMRQLDGELRGIRPRKMRTKRSQAGTYSEDGSAKSDVPNTL